MKKSLFGLIVGLFIINNAQANDLIDNYFTTMQLAVDTANQLATPCIKSLPNGTNKVQTPQCTSFSQAYNIVLDQSDRLNQSLQDTQQSLPIGDSRLQHLQKSVRQLNSAMDQVEPRLQNKPA